MNETLKKKHLHRKYIIPVLLILLFIISALVFIFHMQEQPDPASEKIIRMAAANHLNKDPNELTDSDFAKITEFELCRVAVYH